MTDRAVPFTLSIKVSQLARIERVLTAAVQGMLPNNRLGRVMLSKLKVYGGGTHPHAAQQPKSFPEYV